MPLNRASTPTPPPSGSICLLSTAQVKKECGPPGLDEDDDLTSQLGYICWRSKELTDSFTKVTPEIYDPYSLCRCVEGWGGRGNE